MAMSLLLTAFKISCPIPGYAKMDSMIMEPPMILPRSIASCVTAGSIAFFSPCRKMIVDLDKPLLLAVRI